MVKPTVLSETPVSMVELKTELDKIKKRDGELNFRANKTEEYLGQFVQNTKKKEAELRKILKNLDISRLKEEHVVKILDLLPTSVEELKIILQGFVVTLTQDNLKKIAKAVADFKNG